MSNEKMNENLRKITTMRDKLRYVNNPGFLIYEKIRDFSFAVG